jgi:hypothetical protein
MHDAKYGNAGPIVKPKLGCEGQSGVICRAPRLRWFREHCGRMRELNEDRVLIDGGATNRPFDLLRGRAEVLVAVDISGEPAEKAPAHGARFDHPAESRRIPHSRLPPGKRDPARPEHAKSEIKERLEALLA